MPGGPSTPGADAGLVKKSTAPSFMALMQIEPGATKRAAAQDFAARYEK
jgi:hypothetical protein